MAFTPEPLIPGDLYDGAARLAKQAAQELARLPDPADRAAALGRLWNQVQDLQWPMLMLPEAAGGADGTLDDLVALIDGAARDALPLPLAGVCGVTPMLLAAADPAATGLLAGEALAPCPVLDAYAGWLGHANTPRAVRMPDGTLRLDGTATGVETPFETAGYLLACPMNGGVDDGNATEPALVLVRRDQLSQPPRLFERVDGRLAADLSFAGLVLPAEALLARGPTVRRAVAAALDLGAFLSCVEAQAALGTALELVIAYLSDRKQFGVALSSFQALRHMVAELYVVYETLRATVVHLLHAASPAGTLPPREVALAKLHFGRATRRAAEKIIQLHGGMGMTEELPATRLNKRLVMVEFEYGDTAWHARQLLRDVA